MAVLEIIIMYGDYRGGRWCCARPWRYVGSWVTVVVMRLSVLWVVIMYWDYLGRVMVMSVLLVNLAQNIGLGKKIEKNYRRYRLFSRANIGGFK